MDKKNQRSTAKILLIALMYQLVFPVCAHALTSGPAQPEVQSFEPVGTTEMVDMFTGDFTYNIPLLDVEGYPVNIAYHSGVTIEQEASWVGLGWNINPGEINRAMRGLPDDFNGDTIEKDIQINEETTWRVGLGGTVSFEAFGWDAKKYGINLSLGVGGYASYNNYKGMSIGANTSATISVPFASTGVSLGIGSQSGVDVDVSAGLHASSVIAHDVGGGIGVSGGTGFNTRTGMKDLSFNVSAYMTKYADKTDDNGTPDDKSDDKTYKVQTNQIPGVSFGSNIPIGLQNYVPIVSNPSKMESFEFQARFGGELFYTFPNAYMSIQKSTLTYEQNGDRAGYGYLYAENAPDEGIMDFSRHNDGYYNNTLKNLPLSSMTYDVYSVSGQGTGGVFRPFRNDIGSVFDPKVESPKSHSTSALIEGGIGGVFEVGADVALYDNEANSGPWQRLNFRGNEQGSFFEKVFFKQAGELTYNIQQLTSLSDNTPVYLKDDLYHLVGKNKASAGVLPDKYGDAHIYWKDGNIDRNSRSNLFTFLTGEEATIPEIAEYSKIRQFDTTQAHFYDPDTIVLADRYGTHRDELKAHQMSEITQTLGDGRRYIYGIPVVNHMTREVTFSVNGQSADPSTGQISKISSLQNGSVRGISKEDYYSSTSTPAYASSYLLTSVLSADYMDVLGDGPTDDDLGSWVKFNYTLWDDDYRWRTPSEAGTAQYNPGFLSDPDDDKGSVIIGSRQVWHIRSIESKNYIAEFYVSEREDGLGAGEAVLPNAGTSISLPLGSSITQSKSYKLDTIKLYNKHDRYINEDNATPIKTVIFKYKSSSSSLCTGVPNRSKSGGKLTLEGIYTQYGSSQKNLLNPYKFTYGNYNSSKHGYNIANKDRWGNFKDNSDDGSVTNAEFPYVKQDGQNLDADAAPYELTSIKLPSGGVIDIDYESDDYSFVQDRRTMQMFKIVGVGNNNRKDTKSKLYDDLYHVNDYVYFKRIKDKENPNLSFRDNYLEGAEYLYYCFNMDITGTGINEFVKGYSKIVAVDTCEGDNGDYGYIQLQKERTGKNSELLHPATIYGINLARQYLPQKIYPGFNASGGFMNILQGLIGSAEEFKDIKKGPVIHFVKDKSLGKNINISKSWIRLNRPGLTKKGGGVRVRQLTLNDSWSTLTSNASAEYGKTYDYTASDSKYGVISSGVASYEPLVGGDENPFKLPVKYTADAGRLLPKMEFFQEEPFGEAFFPPPVVGYSKIRVKSIHFDEGRSSKSIEEHQFYTARDFPLEVDYTNKDAPEPQKRKGLRKKSEEVKVYQGYVLRFNDMHGKAKSITNYVINTNGSTYVEDPVSSIKYHYQQDNQGKLDNNVVALYRERGSVNDYQIDTIKLGEEVDFTVDTRERYNRSYLRHIDINLNVVLFGVIPVPVPTSFFPDKEETQTFRSMVCTKVIQKYGLLKSVETFDHGARTTVENLVYDSETGDVLLTQTNNNYDDDVYDLKYPAYWAYEGMGPAYANVGFEINADSLKIEDRNDGSVSCVAIPTYYARLYTDKYNFYPGDELLLSYEVSGITYQVKTWVMDEFGEINFCPSMPSPYPVPGTGSGQQYHRRIVLRSLRDNSGTEQWPGLGEGDGTATVTVKVIRSGRKNQLDKKVQHVRFVEPLSTPYNLDDILNADVSAYDSVLSSVSWEYSDHATPFGSVTGDYLAQGATGIDYDHSILPSDDSAAGKCDLNRYVLGHRGNYRQVAEHHFVADRSYAADNIRYDGTFSTRYHPFWEKLSSSTSNRRILSKKTNIIPYWKAMNQVTKYDVFGNAIEEYDATGKYVSAQYGYNRSLPVAVTDNVRQRSSCFDGFEDYAMLVPENLFSLFKGSYYFQSPFASTYQGVDAGNYIANGNGQNYYKGMDLVSNGDTITRTTSHTGNYSLRLSAPRTFSIVSRDREYEDVGRLGLNYNIKNFGFDSTRYYQVSMWAKPVSGTISSIAGSIGFIYTIGCPNYLAQTSSPSPIIVSSKNIDGWYLITATLDLRSDDICGVDLSLPSGAYFDDFRFIPVGARMKSFVYDPVTFKLTAELDENNFATFYEYDQEGLLIRVKKETDKGIVTIKESRRSNTKN